MLGQTLLYLRHHPASISQLRRVQTGKRARLLHPPEGVGLLHWKQHMRFRCQWYVSFKLRINRGLAPFPLYGNAPERHFLGMQVQRRDLVVRLILCLSYLQRRE